MQTLNLNINTTSKFFLLVAFTFLFNFLGISKNNNLPSKATYKSTCVVSKKKLSKKSIVIKTQENSQYESEVIIEMSDSDFDSFGIHNKYNTIILIAFYQSYFLDKITNYLFYNSELSPPPPRH